MKNLDWIGVEYYEVDEREMNFLIEIELDWIADKHKLFVPLYLLLLILLVYDFI